MTLTPISFLAHDVTIEVNETTHPAYIGKTVTIGKLLNGGTYQAHFYRKEETGELVIQTGHGDFFIGKEVSND